MHVTRVPIVLCFVAGCLVTGITAQSSGPSSQFGILAGQVSDVLTGRGLSDASVTVTSSVSKTTQSDAGGRFLFRDLPAGRYSIAAKLNGYSGGKLGQRFPADSDQAIDLVGAGRIEDITLPLWKTAIVSGVVTDERNDPLVGVVVQAQKSLIVGGQVHLIPDISSKTDDQGRYRLMMAPGSYAIAVPGFTRPVAGSYQAYVTTYYPTGLTDPSIVALAPGQELLSADLQLNTTSSYTVSGVILGVSEVVDGLKVSLSHVIPGGLTTEVPTATTTSLKNGTFEFRRIPSGQYVVSTERLARGPSQPTLMRVFGGSLQFVSAPGAPRLGMPLPSVPDENSIWGRETITVAQDNIDNLVLTLQPGSHLHGRVVLNGSTSPAPTAEQLMSSAVLLVAVDGRESAIPISRLESDLTFRTVSVPDGIYALSVLTAFQGWTVASVKIGGREVIGQPIELGKEQIGDIAIELSDRPSEVAGTVRDSTGRVVATATVFAFPTDRSLWRDYGGVLFSRLRQAKTSRDGSYRLRAVIPGEYYVNAASGSIPEAWTSETFLSSLVRSSIKISLTRGDQQMHNFVISDPARR